MVRSVAFSTIVAVVVLMPAALAVAETRSDVLNRARSDAMLDKDASSPRFALMRACFKSPTLTAPIHIADTRDAEDAARGEFERIVSLLNNLPTNEVGCEDWLRPEITTSLVSLVQQYNGTRTSVTGRLLLGAIHTSMRSSLDFDFGWQMLSHVSACGIDCWQANVARGIQASILLEYARNPLIIAEELQTRLAVFESWKRLRRNRTVRNEVAMYRRAFGTSTSVDDDRTHLSSILRTLLRLGDLREALLVARRLRDDVHHDKKSKEKAEKWLKRIEEGGNPWKEGDWGSMSIGETHPPYPDEK